MTSKRQFSDESTISTFDSDSSRIDGVCVDARATARDVQNMTHTVQKIGNKVRKINLTGRHVRECHEEPIAFIGAIQVDSGAVVVVRDPGHTQTICLYSANAAEVFKCDEILLRGGKLTATDLFGVEFSKKVYTFLQCKRETQTFFTENMHIDVCECNDGMLLIQGQIRKSQTTAKPNANEIKQWIPDFLIQLQRSQSIEDIAIFVTENVKKLTGYSRVMMYKFLCDGTGTIIGDAKEPELESFLELHYPASDIPIQARMLYIKNWVRALRTTDEVIPILNCEGFTPNGPLDMTWCRYRACSPVHIKYLANMKVKASMSISIVVNGQLWGMISCHDYQRQPGIEVELFLLYDIIGRSVSLTIANIEKELLSSRIINTNRRLKDVLESAGSSIAQLTIKNSKVFIDVFEADGYILIVSGKVIYQTGIVPPDEHMEGFINFITTDPRVSTAEHPVVVSDCISSFYEPAKHFAKFVAGVLIVQMAPETIGILMRTEYLQMINWLGKPEKIVVADASGVHFNPRNSFMKYAEQVTLKSKAWDSFLLTEAKQLSLSLIERQRRLQKVIQDRKRAKNSLLAKTKQLSAICKRIRSPATGILAFMGLLSETSLTSSQIQGMEAIMHETDNLVAMINDILAYSRFSESFLTPQTRILDLQQITEHCVQSIKVCFLPSHLPNISVSYDMCRLREECVLVGDEARITKVLMHLMLNAITEKMPHNKVEVRVNLVETGIDENKILLSIQVVEIDHWNPETQLTSLFKIVPGTENSGLRMCIARKIALTMDGDVTAGHMCEKHSVLTFTCPLTYTCRQPYTVRPNSTPPRPSSSTFTSVTTSSNLRSVSNHHSRISTTGSGSDAHRRPH
eukprot:CFRG5792T1